MIYGIIAAGEGSRLSNEGYEGLKPMVFINGEMMIDRLINIFLLNQAEAIYVIINENSEDLLAHLNSLELSVPLNVIIKNTRSSLHSFHELLLAAPGIDALCLTTTDTIFDKEEFGQYINDFISKVDNDGLLAVTSYVDDESPLYINFDSEVKISQITDQPVSADLFVSGGIYCLRKKALALVPVAIETGVDRMRNFQRLMIANDLVLNAYNFKKIMDVDHVSDIEKAEGFLNEIEY